MRSRPYDYRKNKPKGYDDITQQRYEELYEEVQNDRLSQEKFKSKKKRPQTAHFPVKQEFYKKPKSKPKKSKMSKKAEKEYINIVKEYEDVLKHKLKQKSRKKKKEGFSLGRKKIASSRSSKDPYEKYISFYPSQSRETEMFEERFAKE